MDVNDNLDENGDGNDSDFNIIFDNDNSDNSDDVVFVAGVIIATAGYDGDGGDGYDDAYVYEVLMMMTTTIMMTTITMMIIMIIMMIMMIMMIKINVMIIQICLQQTMAVHPDGSVMIAATFFRKRGSPLIGHRRSVWNWMQAWSISRMMT